MEHVGRWRYSHAAACYRLDSVSQGGRAAASATRSAQNSGVAAQPSSSRSWQTHHPGPDDPEAAGDNTGAPQRWWLLCQLTSSGVGFGTIRAMRGVAA